MKRYRRGVTRITDLEESVFWAIRSYWTSKKYSPAMSDLADATGHLPGSIQGAIKNLQRFELITRDQGITRSIVITELGHAWFEEKIGKAA